jgi:hypothetical protein
MLGDYSSFMVQRTNFFRVFAGVLSPSPGGEGRDEGERSSAPPAWHELFSCVWQASALNQGGEPAQ